MWEYRDGYRDQIFLINACIQNLIVELLFCFGWEWSGWREACIFSFECEI